MDYIQGLDPSKFESHFGQVQAAITRAIEKGDVNRERDLVGHCLQLCKSVFLEDITKGHELHYDTLWGRYIDAVRAYDNEVNKSGPTKDRFGNVESRNDRVVRAESTLHLTITQLNGDIGRAMRHTGRWTWRKREINGTPELTLPTDEPPEEAALTLPIE